MLLALCAFSAEEKPKASTIAIDKAIEAQLGPCNKAYDAYQKALEDANKKVIASLEKLKADLNDTKKGSMSLTDRADAIKEVDAKIAEIRKNGLGEAVVASRSVDLLGEGNKSKNSLVGKWVYDDKVFVFNDDMTVTNHWGEEWVCLIENNKVYIIRKVENSNPIPKFTLTINNLNKKVLRGFITNTSKECVFNKE